MLGEPRNEPVRQVSSDERGVLHVVDRRVELGFHGWIHRDVSGIHRPVDPKGEVVCGHSLSPESGRNRIAGEFSQRSQRGDAEPPEDSSEIVLSSG